VRVGALQTQVTPKQYARNRAHVEELLRAAAKESPQIVVMPELFLHGHSYEADRNAEKEPIEGETLAWMRRLSKELGMMLVGGINEAIPGDDRCYSTLLFVDGDALVGIYRKRHPASAELLFLKPGAEAAVFDTRIGRVGLLTCFDSSFPECLMEAFSRRVDLLLIANAWLEMDRLPFLAGQQFEHHRVLPRALAMQLRAPVVVANLVGPLRAVVPGLPAFGGGVFAFDTEFCGGSMICDHLGVVLEERPKTEGAGHVVADVSLAFARGARQVTLEDAGLAEMRRFIFEKANER
jgi:predicted amidohydrolase